MEEQCSWIMMVINGQLNLLGICIPKIDLYFLKLQRIQTEILTNLNIFNQCILQGGDP